MIALFMLEVLVLRIKVTLVDRDNTYQEHNKQAVAVVVLAQSEQIATPILLVMVVMVLQLQSVVLPPLTAAVAVVAVTIAQELVDLAAVDVVQVQQVQ